MNVIFILIVPEKVTSLNGIKKFTIRSFPEVKATLRINASPWLPLRFNVVDGEPYGRGRVEEFMGDLKSLEALMQALVEGSAAAAKVVSQLVLALQQSHRL